MSTNTHTRIACYELTLATLARRADALVARQQRHYSADRAARIRTLRADYDGWLSLAVLRFPAHF